MGDPTREQLIAAMERALDLAREAGDAGDVPVGAVLLDPEGSPVAADRNRKEERSDPTAHAEMLVLAARATDIGDWRLTSHTLVVTLEPCPMCAGAAVAARLGAIVYGAADPRAGAAWSLYNIPQDRRLNHRVRLTRGVLAEPSARLLEDFFSRRRGDGDRRPVPPSVEEGSGTEGDGRDAEG